MVAAPVVRAGSLAALVQCGLRTNEGEAIGPGFVFYPRRGDAIERRIAAHHSAAMASAVTREVSVAISVGRETTCRPGTHCGHDSDSRQTAARRLLVVRGSALEMVELTLPGTTSDAGVVDANPSVGTNGALVAAAWNEAGVTWVARRLGADGQPPELAALHSGVADLGSAVRVDRGVVEILWSTRAADARGSLRLSEWPAAAPALSASLQIAEDRDARLPAVASAARGVAVTWIEGEAIRLGYAPARLRDAVAGADTLSIATHPQRVALALADMNWIAWVDRNGASVGIYVASFVCE